MRTVFLSASFVAKDKVPQIQRELSLKGGHEIITVFPVLIVVLNIKGLTILYDIFFPQLKRCDKRSIIC